MPTWPPVACNIATYIVYDFFFLYFFLFLQFRSQKEHHKKGLMPVRANAMNAVSTIRKYAKA